MNKADKRIGSRQKLTYLIAGTVIILLCVSVSMACASYYNRLQETIREESSSYLQEISKKTSSNIQKIANDNYAMLSTIEAMLKNVEVNDIMQLKDLVGEQKKNWNFRDLLMIDTQGNTINTNGEKISLGDADYLREVIVNKKNSISNSQVINDEECILFTIPIEPIEINSFEICAIGATYRLNTFDKVLETSAFEGAAYTLVINKDGTVAIPSSSSAADEFGYNVLTYLESVSQPKVKKDISAMRADIMDGKSSQIECSIEGIQKYVTYQPVGIQDWYLITFVPVSVANAKSVIMLKITLLFCAFVITLVSVLVLLLTTVFVKHKRKLEKIAYVDAVTGGNTLQAFFRITKEFFDQSLQNDYAVVYTNIEKFRLINEQFGREAGDQILVAGHKIISANLSEYECMCHVMDDHFCMLVKYDNEESLLNRFRKWFCEIQEYLNQNKLGITCPTCQFGVYVVNVTSMAVPLMIDRAKFSLHNLKNDKECHIRYAIYDEAAHQKLFREKQLEDRMEKALRNEEFLVYLQPKYTVDTESPGGAEALVRWKSPEEGMIFPDEFIPLFEKNGFIIQLDLFVFECTCRYIRAWMDKGLEPVRVSINCSRVHFEKNDFLVPYRKIFEKYHIPASYIEIELTESTVYENMQRLSEIIDQIHELGFKCAIDDFGSGYSSLNMIQDIPADVLKLDKIFFKSSKKEDGRAKSVVEGIIKMAKSLSMETVAEGVEYREQVDMLKEVECDYIQGYYFAKPMPEEEFEKLVFGEQ